MPLLKPALVCLIASFLFIPAVDAKTYKIKKPASQIELPEGKQIVDVSFPSTECQNGSTCNLGEFMSAARVCALFVLKDGAIVLQKYAAASEKLCQDVEEDGEEVNDRTREYGVASVTKSITSTLMGAAIAKHYNAKMRSDFEAAVARTVGKVVDPNKTGKIGKNYYKTSLERVLNMRSGITWNDEENGEELDAQVKGLQEAILEFAKHYTKGFGNPFRYSALDASMNGAVAETLMGEPLTTYLEVTFWPALGMEARARWAIDKAETGIGACCFNLTVADLARFGQFVLQKGQTLDGKSLIPSAWFDLATGHAPGDEIPPGNDQYIEGCPFDYHYQWWLRERPETDFTALGRNGEYVHIYPEEKVVIVQISDWQAWNEKYARPCLTLDAHDAIVKAAGQ
jgi:CubicO group peptidase (beta-lactamase class C family)